MTEEQMNQLKSVPFPVFYYYCMSGDFEVTKVEVDFFSPCGVSYKITYSDGMSGEIIFQGTAGGVGDVMPGVKQVPFSNMLYGSGKVEVYAPDSEEGLAFRSHWIGNWRPGAFYSFAATKGVAERYIKLISDGIVELE